MLAIMPFAMGHHVAFYVQLKHNKRLHKNAPPIRPPPKAHTNKITQPTHSGYYNPAAGITIVAERAELPFYYYYWHIELQRVESLSPFPYISPQPRFPWTTQ